MYLLPIYTQQFTDSFTALLLLIATRYTGIQQQPAACRQFIHRFFIRTDGQHSGFELLALVLP